jgi:hypothetical protein
VDRQSSFRAYGWAKLLALFFLLGMTFACGGGGSSSGPPPGTPPTFVSEVHSATDGFGSEFNSSTLSINVTGTNPVLIAAWHSEFDGGSPDGWVVQDNGVDGTEIVDTDGYSGGSGNRRFRIYYWANPAPGAHTVTVANPYNGANELAFAVILLNGVSQVTPVGTPVLDVSTDPRTGESETTPSTTNDLIVHVIADQLVVTGTLGSGETSRSLANDGKHSPPSGDASLWISTKPGASGSTTVSSSGWASFVMNGVAIPVHGN